MKNKEVADVLYEIADLLEMKDVEWKPRAYRKAARSVESLSEPIEDIYDRGDLEEIDGVGESIAEKISQYLDTGKLEYYEDLKDELPVNIEALTSVEGIGPKTARKLYSELSIKDLDELEEAAKKGKIANVEGFGEKTQENILEHIEMAKTGEHRMLLGRAFPIAENIRGKLESSDNFNIVEIVGSFRRQRPTVGDLDILATSRNPGKAMRDFCDMEDVKEVLSEGETKSSIIVSGDLRMDLRIIDKKSWGAALVYFTGSKDHNITLRNLAIEKDLKLNEYGIFKQNEQKMISGETEKDIYKTLDLDFIPPEMREDTGEVEPAKKGNLPDLVEIDDINGDLQIHTNYSDGENSIKKITEKADKIGYDYILITDHGPSLHVAGGPSSKDTLMEQKKEIKSANEKYNVDILQGMEVNVTKNGIDISDEMIETLDLIVLAMHNKLKNPTKHIFKALENYSIDIFAHPLNRMINERKPLDLEMDKIIKKAKEKNVAIEINSQPKRLDLPWNLVKKYRGEVKFVVSTDAHTIGELDYMHLGISQARRGWLESDDVLNTSSLKELKSYFK